MVVVEDVEVGCMARVANKRKRMGANSIVSAQPALPSDSLGLPQRLRRASAKRERTPQADPNAKKGGAGKKADRTAPRTRLSVEKMALLAEVDKGIYQENVAGRFKCTVRTVQSINQNRKDIQKQADTKAKRLQVYSAGYALYRRKSILCGCPV